MKKSYRTNGKHSNEAIHTLWESEKEKREKGQKAYF